ncbi:MAG: YidC/Oxa1 family insertase periplasmic-domain containing protein [Planctomycetes bacterium]|nr:YidC/Oxa1 family insertase periplasmic-domain containing protein [Planctomycetota bacterium]MCB9905340.1 YidC/Oxa1 family insertase periplasmic-domain containing protein [Planctomycetota bacterium]
MEKRLPFVLLLTALAIVSIQLLRKDDAAAKGDAGSAGPSAPAVVQETFAAPKDGAERRVADAEERFVLNIGTPGEHGSYRAEFTNRGAQLLDLLAADYYDAVDRSDNEKHDPTHWVTIVRSVNTHLGPTGSLVWTGRESARPLLTEDMGDALWKHEVLKDASGGDVGVRFEYAPGSGVVFTKTLRAVPGTHTFDLELGIENVSAEGLAPAAQFRLVTADSVPASDAAWYRGPSACVGWRADDGKVVVGQHVRKEKPGNDRSGDLSGAGSMSFIGAHDKYFSFFLFPAEGQDPRALHGASWRAVYDEDWSSQPEHDPTKGWRTVAADLDLKLVVPPVGQRSVTKLVVYAGPKSHSEMVAANPDLQELIDTELGMFALIAHAILGILGFFHGLVGNWGWAIILMTLTVRGLLFPINRRSQTAMARFQTKMKRIQPKIDEIKERYKNDPQQQRQEQTRIMQEEGAFPPLGGCLPIFLQFPVFIGLFAALRLSFDLRQQPFMGWIHDLSEPDRLMRIDFNTHLPFIGTIEYLNVLPLLMVVLWIWQQRAMPTPTDEQQARMQKMMMWMPIAFGFMLYNYAAGLSLYMITSSAWGIIEIRVIKKIWPLDDTEKPKKQNGFMAKLAEAQRQKIKELEASQARKAAAARGGKRR